MYLNKFDFNFLQTFHDEQNIQKKRRQMREVFTELRVSIIFFLKSESLKKKKILIAYFQDQHLFFYTISGI